MASLNKVMLIGHVGREPEVRYIDNGVATAVVSLATNTPGYTLPGGTQVPERTEWHRIMLWRRLAEIVERYVHKGDQLYVEGQLRTRSYTDKKGKEQEVITFYVSDDRNHLPIRLDMFLHFGSAKAFLKSVRGNRYPLTSVVTK